MAYALPEMAGKGLSNRVARTYLSKDGWMCRPGRCYLQKFQFLWRVLPAAECPRVNVYTSIHPMGQNHDGGLL